MPLPPTTTHPAVPLQPALPMELPPKPMVPGRLRTNEDWLAQQPELYQEVRDRICGGDTNVRRLALEYADQRWNSKTKQPGIDTDAMRRAITAMIDNDIGRPRFDEIVQTQLAVLRAEMVDAASRAGATAEDPKHLGALAMTMKLATDTMAGMGGAPQQVIKHEHQHLHVHTTPEALQHRRLQHLASAPGSVVEEGNAERSGPAAKDSAT